MTAVQCKFCRFEKESKCSKKKNATVQLNKRRACKLYEVDTPRVIEFAEHKMATSKPQIVQRPEWFWDKQARKVATRELILNEEAIKQFDTTIDANVVEPPKDRSHPLTGDLSRFMSSADNEIPIAENKEN